MTNQEIAEQYGEHESNWLPTDLQVQELLTFLITHPWLSAFANRGTVNLFHFDKSFTDAINTHEALEETFAAAMSACYQWLYAYLSFHQVKGASKRAQNAAAKAICERHVKVLADCGFEVSYTCDRVNEDELDGPQYQCQYFVKSPQGWSVMLDAFNSLKKD